jgi:hypothetical protein
MCAGNQLDSDGYPDAIAMIKHTSMFDINESICMHINQHFLANSTKEAYKEYHWYVHSVVALEQV